MNCTHLIESEIPLPCSQDHATSP